MGGFVVTPEEAAKVAALIYSAADDNADAPIWALARSLKYFPELEEPIKNIFSCGDGNGGDYRVGDASWDEIKKEALDIDLENNGKGDYITDSINTLIVWANGSKGSKQ
jgi:hypothetical protein